VRLAGCSARIPDPSDYIYCAFAPGGFADSVARLIGSKLSERLGQSIIIENRAGGGGNISAAVVSKAAIDGYTMLVTTTGLVINETLSKSKGFALDDLEVVAIPAWAPETLSVPCIKRPRCLARV
jgi:tripartite-type tricarboxylate transporter receptor subunit TctC